MDEYVSLVYVWHKYDDPSSAPILQGVFTSFGNAVESVVANNELCIEYFMGYDAPCEHDESEFQERVRKELLEYGKIDDEEIFYMIEDVKLNEWF